jgi:hypothetical protein
MLRFQSIRTNPFRFLSRCRKLLWRMNCGRLWGWKVYGSWPGSCPVASFIISGFKYSSILTSVTWHVFSSRPSLPNKLCQVINVYFFSPWTWVLSGGKLSAYRAGRCTLGRRPRYPLNRPHCLSADFGGDLNLHPQGMEPLFLRCPVRGLFNWIYRLSDAGSHISLFFDTGMCGVLFGVIGAMILTSVSCCCYRDT